MPRTRSNAPPAKVPKVAEASRLSSPQNQKQDASATLSPAPKGRNILAQGNALGSRHPTNSSPVGAAQGWRIAKISDFAKTTSGGTPSRTNPEFYTGNIPWIKSGDLNDGNVREATEFITEEALKSSSAKLFPAGTLMIALYGATIGKLGILTIQAATNQAVCGIFVSEQVETKYLFYFLLYHRRALIKLGAGGAQPNISQGIIRDIEVPLPPLPEQRRIVARIEELFSRLDAGVAALRHAKAQLQRYRQSVLAAAVTGQLTQEWREQHPDTEPAGDLLKRILEKRRKQWDGSRKDKEATIPNAESLPELPKGWSWSPVQNLSEPKEDAIFAGPFGTIFKAKDFRDQGIPIIFLRHVGPDQYRTHKLGFMDRKKWTDIFQPYSVWGGELLVTKLGDPPGVCCEYPEGIGPAMVTPDVIKLSVNEHVASKRYFISYFNSEIARRFTFGVAYGTTRMRLTLPIFRSMPVPLPPLAEQHQIVAEVESRTTAIDHLDAELDRQITRSNRLRQSTLHEAFKGGLI